VLAQGQLHSATEPIEIRGLIRLAGGNAPAENVIVRLEKLSGGLVAEEQTDRLGKFRFSGLEPTQYIVMVRQLGYVEIRREVNLVMTSAEYVQLQLIPDNSSNSSGLVPSRLLDANVPAEARKEFEKGEASIFSRKIPEGISHLEKAVAIYPNFLEAELRLGTAYMDTKQFEKAERSLRRALEINSKTANAFFALGELYLQQKKYNESTKALRQGLAIENRSWQGHLTLGRAYWDTGDVVQAGRQVALALQLKPDYAEAHLLAGNIFLRAHKLEDAQIEFEEYLKLAPKGEFAAQAQEAVQKIKHARSGKD
jgi:tetratricopeptide (TPR) repeat protein